MPRVALVEPILLTLPRCLCLPLTFPMCHYWSRYCLPFQGVFVHPSLSPYATIGVDTAYPSRVSVFTLSLSPCATSGADTTYLSRVSLFTPHFPHVPLVESILLTLPGCLCLPSPLSPCATSGADTAYPSRVSLFTPHFPHLPLVESILLTLPGCLCLSSPSSHVPLVEPILLILPGCLCLPLTFPMCH